MTLKSFFKQFNKLMILFWRLGLGPWINISPEMMGRMMTLTTTGRKSGLKRHMPVNYALGDGEVYCMAAFGRQSEQTRHYGRWGVTCLWCAFGWNSRSVAPAGQAT